MGEKTFPPSERCPCGRTGKPFAECCLAEGVNLDKLRENTVIALQAANAPPQIVYAYERTGMLVVSGYRDVWSAADLDEWDDAISEYMERANGEPMNWIDMARFEPLVACLYEIDAQLDVLSNVISESPDPDGEGLLDEAEGVAGEGFLQCQLYMIERKGEHDPARPHPYRCGPAFNGRFVAEIINVAGNYRKHFGEWPSDETKYGKQQKDAVAVFMDAGVTSADYRLSNLLSKLTSPAIARFAALVPLLIEWREAVDRLPS